MDHVKEMSGGSFGVSASRHVKMLWKNISLHANYVCVIAMEFGNERDTTQERRLDVYSGLVRRKTMT